MKGKIFGVVVLLVVGLAFSLNWQTAQANHSSFAAISNVFSALNLGKVDMALAAFTSDATVENLVRAETYRGLSEIRQMLQGMQRAGRQFDIVAMELDGDTLTAQVEVSDGGHVWGTQTIEAAVKDGHLQTLAMTAFRLELWRIGR